MRLITSRGWPQGLYSISEDGRVFSHVTDKFLTSSGVRRGYTVVGSTLKGHRFGGAVHCLVCWEFNGKPPTPEHEVNHKDGIKSNNHYKNLEWVTHARNVRHAYEIGLAKGVSRPGQQSHTASLTDEVAKRLREMRRAGVPIKSLIELSGLKQVSVYALLRGVTYRTAGGPISKGHCKGSAHPRASVTQATVDDIRADRAKGFAFKDLLVKYGLSSGCLHAIITHKTWNTQ